MYLSKVVKVVFVMNPSIVGSQAVRFIRDVLHIKTHTVVELSFEELVRKTNTEREMSDTGKTKIHFDEIMTPPVCSILSCSF